MVVRSQSLLGLHTELPNEIINRWHSGLINTLKATVRDRFDNQLMSKSASELHLIELTQYRAH